MRFFLMFVCISFSTYSLAQENEKELDPITVTATLTPLSVSKTGRNIQVIKGDQINKLPVNSIDELIRYIPGVEVQSRGPMGVQSNITIRGGTFQQVLIILDGIRLNDPLTGHFNSYIPISPAEIDRIEILKGASSAIYGNDAVGGVVHIITKTFAGNFKSDATYINAQFAAGEYALKNLQAGGGFHKNKTTGSIGLITNNASGQPLRGTKGFFNLTTLSVSVKQEIGTNWSIAYRFGLDDRNFNAQNFYSSRLSDTATEYVNSTWNHLKTQFKNNKHQLTLDLGSKKTLDQYQFNKSLNPNINNSKMKQALLIYNFQLNEHTGITAGTQYIERFITSNDRGDHTVQSAGIFALVNTTVVDSLNLSIGLRTDWNSLSGWQILPQINANYRYEGFLFRGGIGRTSREADFTERFNNYKRSPVPGGSRIGNPDLTAETSISYELGVDYFLSKNLKVSTTWFERYYTDLIDWVRKPYADIPRQVNLIPNASYDLASNIQKVNTTGIETDIQYTQVFGKYHSVTSGVGGVWMRSRSNDSIPSLYVSNHAKEFINFFISYRKKALGLSVNGLYKERNPQSQIAGLVPLSKSYFLTNFRMDIYMGGDEFACYLQIDNVFNKSYSDILGSVLPNRWIIFGLKWNFKK